MAEIVKVTSDSDAEAAAQLAASILRGGGLVAFPTETVYGIGVHMEDKVAVTRLYRLKERPSEKPLTLHIGSLSDLDRYGIEATPREHHLIRHCWPGPLTLILRNRKGQTVGVRWPRHELACRILKAAGVPVGCPSANLSGEEPATTAGEVAKGLRAQIDLIIDGGKTELGVSSTVAVAEGKSLKILREGAIAAETLRELWEERGGS